MILLTGATGYVGGRLRAALEAKGRPLRCLLRQPDVLKGSVGPRTELVAGDVLDSASLGPALAGVETAFYLVHSMGMGEDFEALDRRGAQQFAEACAKAGVKRVIYLGGLSDPRATLSPHLRSRLEVGEILREKVPTWEFRASIIIGSGSLSFEMIRALVERLPVMITPRWVKTQAQPIGIEDVITYLIEALNAPGEGSRVIEIGGPDVMSYGDLMQEYARQRGLTRWMIPVPVLTPHLSSLWLGLVTPLYARVGRKLIESLRYPSVVHDPRGMSTFSVMPRGVSEAIARALSQEDAAFAATRWSDAVSSSLLKPGKPRRFGNRIVDSRAVPVQAPAEATFAAVTRIGGKTGWYYADFLWQLRGALDILVGGIGLRRGRRDPAQLRPGDALDFWRVDAVEAARRLRLRAEMKLPGRAWLEFEITPKDSGCELRQTAIFDPVGLAGLLYWWVLYPVHVVIFRGMLRRIATTAERRLA